MSFRVGGYGKYYFSRTEFRFRGYGKYIFSRTDFRFRGYGKYYFSCIEVGTKTSDRIFLVHCGLWSTEPIVQLYLFLSEKGYDQRHAWLFVCYHAYQVSK